MIKPPFDLRCEYLYNPIEIDIISPRFSWVLMHEERGQNQSAYQIIVSSDHTFSESENGDIWDSGRVKSENSVNILYKGKPLKSNSIYYWRVKWWDANDEVSNYSAIAKFETALLNESDWKAKWISRKEFLDKKEGKAFQYKTGGIGLGGIIREYHALYLRKEFTFTKSIQKAKVYICGLGVYELRINGEKIGNRILEPAMTDYNTIALYSTYDITNSLQDKNAVGVILGNGRHLKVYGYDFPKLILQIHIRFKDDTNIIICSDETWKVSQGPILENGIYYGEKYDARLEMPGWDKSNFNDSSWQNAILVKGPRLSSQMIQPIKITKILTPQGLYSPKPGIYIYDFGQNFTGFIRLKARGSRGTQINIRHAENTYEDGTLNIGTNRNAEATDIYILKGNGEEILESHFTYHGFRYIEITGFLGVPTIENIQGLFFHTSVIKTGIFLCSNELINQIHTNIIWSQLSNLMSIPTDCPQRDERHGWMGDAQLTVEEAILNFDMARFYSKYLRDIRLSQKENGSLPDVVPPYLKYYPADPAWSSAYITIAYYLYWYYNDIKIVEENYESMKKYVNFLNSQAEDNILYKLSKWGDWCPPSSIVSRKTPNEHVSTFYYYHDTLILSKFAKILGKEADYIELSKMAEIIKEAYNKKFLKWAYDVNKLSPVDDTISQTSNILPLYLNMVPENKKKDVISRLLESIIEAHDYHIDTGIVGTRYLFEVLTENGYTDIAYKIINQKSYPGWGYMIKESATTLWERWEKLEGRGMNSHNHIMFGSVDTWFFKVLAGINALEAGWKKMRIKPFIPPDLKHVTASLNTIKGVVNVSWEKGDDSLKIIIKIPVGCVSEIWIPVDNVECTIKEGDIIIWKEGEIAERVNGVEYKRMEENFIVFNIGSGYFNFNIQHNPL